MDPGDEISPRISREAPSDSDEDFQSAQPQRRSRQLPSDLPTSLDDRRVGSSGYQIEETEVYDPWNNNISYVKNPAASPLKFNLAIGRDDEEDDFGAGFGRDDGEAFNRAAEDNDQRLMEMLAAQAALREGGEGGKDGPDERTIAEDKKLSDEQKRVILQKALHTAASNGDEPRVRRLLEGPPKKYVEVNAPDDEGTPPLIYASCFGHGEVVAALLAAGAAVDVQDQKNKWTALMWAMTNRHKDIAKTLLDNGASPDVQTSSGRRAYDFAQPNSELSNFLQDNGYRLGDAGVSGEDFYHAGHEDMLELEAENREMERRMAMARDAHVNLEVDLSNLGVEDQPEDPDELDDHQDFVWDRCLHDQMFVFQESDLERILDVVITDMVPQRSQLQKPVPANVIFLAARYAHYHNSASLLDLLLNRAETKIDDKVKTHQWDMSVLAFWLSNVTLLLYYLQRDPGLIEVSSPFQVTLKGLIEDIFILIIRDAERRINRILFTAILDFEAFPLGIEFANEWKNPFKSKKQIETPDFVSGTRPQPIGKATKPGNVSSILDSVLYVLDLYDVHSVIVCQLISQIMYWIGAELFNAILQERKYMARSKAMQIRMNISVLQEWAQKNNRVPEHYESGSLSPSGESTLATTRKHLQNVDQLVQWLQIYSGSSDDIVDLEITLKTLLPSLTTQQLLEVASHYRYEVNEQYAPKSVRKFLSARQYEERKRRTEARKARAAAASPSTAKSRPLSAMFGGGGGGAGSKDSRPKTPEPGSQAASNGPSAAASPATPQLMPPPSSSSLDDEPDLSEPKLLLSTNHELGFQAPTSFDMRVSYGAGIGGMNKERERKYQPSVPPDFLGKLDPPEERRNGQGNGNGRVS